MGDYSMGFIKEYGIMIGAVLIVALIGYVWHVRGSLDSATVIAGTVKTVQPIREKENAIKNHPLAADAIIKRLRGAKF